MINLVIDTNTIVSAVISPNGNPAKVIKLLATNANMQIYYSVDILDEYKRVLSYERLNLPIENRENMLNLIRELGILIEPKLSTISFADENDRVFYDVAKTVDAYLITGNLKHFPSESRIVTSTQFVEKFEVKE